MQGELGLLWGWWQRHFFRLHRPHGDSAAPLGALLLFTLLQSGGQPNIVLRRRLHPSGHGNTTAICLLPAVRCLWESSTTSASYRTTQRATETCGCGGQMHATTRGVC
jgi:hypothetical protein